jgi:hypothetical protein
MTIWTRIGAAVGAPLLLWSGSAFGQAAQPPAHQGSTPRVVEGRVVRIDTTRERITIRASDGTMHEFQASKETLRDLREGDTIEARLRQP